MLLLAAVATAGRMQSLTVSLTASPATTYIQLVLQLLGNTAPRGIPINIQIPVKIPESSKESRAIVKQNYFPVPTTRPQAHCPRDGKGGGSGGYGDRQSMAWYVHLVNSP